MKNLIKLQSVEVETGKTIVKIAISANEVPHPQFTLSSEQEQENKNAIIFLENMMTNLGFKLEAPKIWVKPNNWIDKNDNIDDVFDMDFSDIFPANEKSRITNMINNSLKNK